jgi:hypothetical protein
MDMKKVCNWIIGAAVMYVEMQIHLYYYVNYTELYLQNSSV